jgi:hypothetical protein
VFDGGGGEAGAAAVIITLEDAAVPAFAPILRQPPASLPSRAMIAFLGRPRAVMAAEGHVRSWQYFSRVKIKKPGESIAAPKGRGSRTPDLFPSAKGPLLGTATGDTMAIADPLWAGTICGKPRRGGGREPCPVVAVLLATSKKGTRVHRCPQRARTPDSFGFSAAN